MSGTYLSGEQTKLNILRESKHLFYEKGYTDTTYTEISSTTRINRALIPYHFKSKQALGIAIYQEIIQQFYEMMDQILDTKQFDLDFINILYTVAYYRLLATNQPFIRFISELQADEASQLFDTDTESQWILGLGNKFKSLGENELYILTQIHIGAKKEMLSLLNNKPNTILAVDVAKTHIHMLMKYVGYSSKKIEELIDASVEITDLLSFHIGDGFSIEIGYN